MSFQDITGGSIEITTDKELLGLGYTKDIFHVSYKFRSLTITVTTEKSQSIPAIVQTFLSNELLISDGPDN